MPSLVNLTPHAITVQGDGTLILPPSGKIARLAVARAARPAVVVSPGEYPGLSSPVTLPVVRPTLGEIADLPAPTEGVLFIVSALVAEAAKRADVLSPGELIRDDKGVIVACRGLCSYV